MLAHSSDRQRPLSFEVALNVPLVSRGRPRGNRASGEGSAVSCTLVLHLGAHVDAAFKELLTGSGVFAFALIENFGRIVSRPLYRGYRDEARCFVTSQYRNKEKEPEQAKGRRVYR